MKTVAALLLCLSLSCSQPTAPLPLAPQRPVPLGVVTHSFSDNDGATLAALHVGSVRIPWYGDTAQLRAQLTVAEQYGFHVIIVAQAPITETFVSLVGRLVQVQLGNEPLNLIAYASTFRSTLQLYGSRLTLIPAGVANGTDAETIRKAIAAGLGDAGVLCIHVYGTPLVNAVKDRVQVTKDAGWTGQVMFTEVGTLVDAELAPALAAVPADVLVWVYALYSPADGYTLDGVQLSVIRQFTTGIQQ